MGQHKLTNTFNSVLYKFLRPAPTPTPPSPSPSPSAFASWWVIPTTADWVHTSTYHHLLVKGGPRYHPNIYRKLQAIELHTRADFNLVQRAYIIQNSDVITQLELRRATLSNQHRQAAFKSNDWHRSSDYPRRLRFLSHLHHLAYEGPWLPHVHVFSFLSFWRPCFFLKKHCCSFL